MRDSEDFAVSAENRKELYEKLGSIWDLGANVIIGWRVAADGIELLYLPSLELPIAAKRHRGLLERDRHMGDSDRYRDFLDAGCQTAQVPLSFEVCEAGPFIKQMESILRYYTVTHSKSRAVALFDIVQFSHHSAFVGISQINILSFHANLAASHVTAAGLPIDLNMSTTGDGFYIWNRNEGLAADLALFYVTGLVLAYNQFALDDQPHNALPVLRCCFGFGEHYEYYQASGSKPDSRGFIVGDVTIDLDRLISSALPKQLLIASRIRPNDAPGGNDSLIENAPRIDMPMFFNFAQQNASVLKESPIGNGRIADIRVALTGDALSEHEHTIRKYEVIDKHGFSHRCFNATFDVRDSLGMEINTGLPAESLIDFGALHIEKEDVKIKVL